MEVLVALFLLAIGVLGFSILQMRALDATQEATERSVAMNIARDLAERMRVNKDINANYEKIINSKETYTDCVGSSVNYKPICTSTLMARFDAGEILAKAQAAGQTLVINKCVGSSTLNCIYISWGKTVITATDQSKCVDTTTGTYIVNSKCLIMEAF